MRTQYRDPLTPSHGGAPPPSISPPGVVDEGPMRAELLWQIRRLEIELSRFVAANCPYDHVRVSQRRGPAILTTAQLEEIRDELLAARTALHDLVVRRVTERMHEPEPRARTAWWRRLWRRPAP